eukprot:TRINITY_DN7727_c0_g2_i1.p1 TRINITY_DN7727_c0_g2~~TRINITY_DN7727_c0_g2_i1.p1  ORF type:complete len:697 (-),score=91.14 TRINITY_DN7727_c0_g2_i1:174-2264(-)
MRSVHLPMGEETERKELEDLKLTPRRSSRDLLSASLVGTHVDSKLSVETWHFGQPGSLAFRALFFQDGQLISPLHDIPLYAPRGFIRCICSTPAGQWARHTVLQSEPYTPIAPAQVDGKPRHFGRNAPWNLVVFPRSLATEWGESESDTSASSSSFPALEAIDIGAEHPRQVGEVYLVKLLGCVETSSGSSGGDGNGSCWKILCIDMEDPMSGFLRDTRDVQALLPGNLELISLWLTAGDETRPQGDQVGAPHVEHAQAAASLVAEAHSEWQLHPSVEKSREVPLKDDGEPVRTRAHAEKHWERILANISHKIFPIRQGGAGEFPAYDQHWGIAGLSIIPSPPSGDEAACLFEPKKSPGVLKKMKKGVRRLFLDTSSDTAVSASLTRSSRLGGASTTPKSSSAASLGTALWARGEAEDDLANAARAGDDGELRRVLTRSRTVLVRGKEKGGEFTFGRSKTQWTGHPVEERGSPTQGAKSGSVFPKSGPQFPTTSMPDTYSRASTVRGSGRKVRGMLATMASRRGSPFSAPNPEIPRSAVVVDPGMARHSFSDAGPGSTSTSSSTFTSTSTFTAHEGEWGDGVSPEGARPPMLRTPSGLHPTTTMHTVSPGHCPSRFLSTRLSFDEGENTALASSYQLSPPCEEMPLNARRSLSHESHIAAVSRGTTPESPRSALASRPGGRRRSLPSVTFKDIAAE